MLNELRNQANNPILLFLLAIIGVVFVFTFGSWGGSDVSGAMPVVAKVNGHTITRRDFVNSYGRAIRGVDEKKRAGVADKVLDQLIDRELMAQEALRRGLVATDEELATAIKDTVFGDEPYDKAEYHRLLRERYGQNSPAHFEEEMRRDLNVQKLQQVIIDAQKVSPAELEETFREQNDKVDLHIVKIDPMYYKKKLSDPTDEELKTWADKNEDKLKADYDKRITKYRTPKKVKARHILIKVAEDAAKADVDAAQAKIDAAKKRVDGGEDFATVAKEVSEEPGAKASGGDLGFFGPGAMVKPFEKAAYALEKDQISDVVRTKFGFHVIKVEDIQDEKIKEFDTVKMNIARTLFKEDKAMEQAQALAQNALDQLKAGKEPKALELPDFRTGEEVLTDEKPDPYAPRLDATGPFARGGQFGLGGYVPRVGIAQDVMDAAFGLTTEKPLPEKAFEVAGRLYVLKLKERTQPDMAKFEEQKADLEKNLLNRRTYQAVEQFIKELRTGAEIWKDPETLGQAS